MGAALMTKVLHEAETRDVNRLYAYVREDNKVTHTFYHDFCSQLKYCKV